MLPSLMLFSVVWSLGASCDKGGRAAFDRHLREHIQHRVSSGAMLLHPDAMFPEVSDRNRVYIGPRGAVKIYTVRLGEYGGFSLTGTCASTSSTVCRPGRCCYTLMPCFQR